MSRSIVVLGRNPFEAYMLAACVLSGVAGFFPHAPLSSIDLISANLSWIWYGGLVVGGVLGLVALWTRFPLGILLSRIAMLILAGLSLAYGSALYVLLSYTEVHSDGIVIGVFGLVCAIRVWQITKLIRQATKSPPPGPGPGPV